MALYCLPITAKILQPFDAELASDMASFASSLQEPTKRGMFLSIKKLVKETRT